MKSLLNKSSIIFVALLILLAGIFCSQGLQAMNSHCSGDANSMWCSKFLVHGTMISDVTLNTVSTTLLALVAVALLKPFIGLLNKIRLIVSYFSRVKNKIPILSPIQLAISNGIIHPRIP